MADPISTLGSVGQVQFSAPVTLPSRTTPKRVEEAPVDPKVAAGERAASSTPLMDRAESVFLDLTQRVSEDSANPPPPSLEEAAEAFRTYLKGLPSNLQFRADRESGLYVFKVVNPVTQEVIRQFPPDEVLEMAKRIKEQLAKGSAGILLDEKL